MVGGKFPYLATTIGVRKHATAARKALVYGFFGKEKCQSCMGKQSAGFGKYNYLPLRFAQTENHPLRKTRPTARAARRTAQPRPHRLRKCRTALSKAARAPR